MIRKPTPSLSLSRARCFTRELPRSRIIIIVTVVVKVVKKELHLAIEGLSQIAQKAKKGNESNKKKKNRRGNQQIDLTDKLKILIKTKFTFYIKHVKKKKKINEKKKKTNRKEKIIKTQTWLDTKFTSVATALQLFPPFFFLFSSSYERQEKKDRICVQVRERTSRASGRTRAWICKCFLLLARRNEKKKKCEKEQTRWCDRQEKL